MRTKQKNINKKSIVYASVVLLFSLSAIYGLSLLTGNDTQSNIGNSLASSTEPADINNDNFVNVFDLSILLSKWNTSDPTSDLNKDGTVSIFDLSILLSKWGAVGSTGWKVYWSDEFNELKLNTNNWEAYDPINNNGRYGDGDPGYLPCNTAANITFNEGSMFIKSKKETKLCNKGITTEYTTGFIGSRDVSRYYPLFGRYEIRARIPHGQGIWPAFWLRHVNTASAAEVDILEVFHNSDPGSVTQSLHFPNSIGSNVAKKGMPFEVPVIGSGDWHIFAVDIEQVYPGRYDTVRFTFWVDDIKTLIYTNTNASSWADIADKNMAWDIALNTAIGGQWVGHPDQALGWGSANGGMCTLERPQRLTPDSTSCSKERTAGRWYNDVLTKAPSQDGIDDIWLAPWNYGQPSADYIIDYVRVYSR